MHVCIFISIVKSNILKQANVGSALLTTYLALQALQDPFDAVELAEQVMQFDGQAKSKSIQ